MMERNGILSAGNFIVDIVKVIDLWPPLESLANIRYQYYANGGGAYNVLKDLAIMQAPFPLQAAGLVGKDHWGRWILEDCSNHGIDVGQLDTTAASDTSYTDVMTLEKGGKRTFFHYRGANALLERHHIDLDRNQAKILHLAYLLLLDQLDRTDAEGVSEAARLLQDASERGFLTSVDLVSVQDPESEKIVRSALPYTDFLFLNELEAARITGIQTYDQGQISPEKAEQACRRLLNDGVRKWVFLHFPEGVVAMDAHGTSWLQGSVFLPESRIAGTVGAGDAFAAGVLLGLHEQWAIEDTLKLGVCAAAACLMNPTSSGGLLPEAECRSIGNQFGFRIL